MNEKTREILKKIRRIEIRTKRIVNSVFSGEYHSSFKGRGMEFDEVRSYEYGDDVRDIDWNVSARMNAPYIKRYREERELTSMILFDASASNEFGSTGVLKGEAAAEIAALLAFAAVRNNDKVGLVVFTGQIEKYIPPKKGRIHALRIIREILFFQTVSKKTDIGMVIDFLNRVQRKRGVVFLISDMLSENFSLPLKLAGRRHDFTAIKITDPREMSFPDIGLIELEDAETQNAMIIDTSDAVFLKRYTSANRQFRDELEKIFKRHAIGYVNLNLGENYFDALVRFFRKKAKKVWA